MASPSMIRGYVITAASFFIACGMISPLSSYGRLFTGIQDDLNTTATQTGWIGSIPWAVGYLMSPIALASENYLGYRPTVLLGAVITSGCYLLSSLMTSFVGVFLTLGMLNGFAIGLSLHAALCVLFKYFSSSGRTRASGVTGLGCAFGAVPLSVFYEKIVPSHGWRFALQVSSIIAAVLSIPASFLMKPDANHFRSRASHIEEDEIEECDSKTPPETFDISEKCEVEVMSTEHEHSVATSFHKLYSTCFDTFFVSRTWSTFVVILLPAISWAVLWTYPISYFESISVPEEDILLYVSVTTISDLLGRVALVFFVGFLPMTESGLLLTSNLTMAVVTLTFVLVPFKPVLIICSVVIGVGRGWYNILPYKAGVDLLEMDDPDKGLTVVMVSLGVAFTVGTLPTGAIYDATSSYTYAFIMNAVLFLLAGIIQLSMHTLRYIERRRNTRRPHFEKVDAVEKI